MELYYVLFEMVFDWPIGTLLFSLIVLSLGLLLVLLFMGIYYIGDSWFRPKELAVGKITHKKFTPAHTEFIFIWNAATQTALPHPVYHPDDWVLIVRVANDLGEISVSKAHYNRRQIGDSVSVMFVRGRLSHGLYLREIS